MMAIKRQGDADDWGWGSSDGETAVVYMDGVDWQHQLLDQAVRNVYLPLRQANWCVSYPTVLSGQQAYILELRRLAEEADESWWEVKAIRAEYRRLLAQEKHHST